MLKNDLACTPHYKNSNHLWTGAQNVAHFKVDQFSDPGLVSSAKLLSYGCTGSLLPPTDLASVGHEDQEGGGVMQ